MTELVSALQVAVNTYHPMRKPNHDGWLYCGMFELNGLTYAYASESTSEGVRITCRNVSKKDNESNMSANHWFILEHGKGNDKMLYIRNLVNQ